MNIFAKLKNYLFRSLSLTDEKAWDKSLWNLAGSQSLSGEIVTESTALTYSAVWNAVSLISGTIGALPLHLMQRKGDKKRIADDYLTYRVLHDQANPLMTAMAFREAMMAHILTWGNGFAEMVRNGYGEVMELWPITPNRVRIEMRDGEMIYRIKMDRDGDIFLPRDKVLHIAGLGFDGFQGYSVISMARKSLGLGMALETFGARFFGNGTNPSMVVSHPGKLKDPKEMRDAMAHVYAGLGNTHRMMLLEEGMKVEKYGIPPNDCQFLESRSFQIPEVARWFNLPPHKLKDLTKSSFSNIESEQISFVTDSILPWAVRLEANYNMQLLTKYDKELSGRGRLYFKHSLEGLLRGDSASRASFYTAMFNIGAFSPNDIREKEDMDPVPGGDIRLVPMNMVSLENAGKPPEKAPPPVPQIPETVPENGKEKELKT